MAAPTVPAAARIDTATSWPWELSAAVRDEQIGRLRERVGGGRYRVDSDVVARAVQAAAAEARRSAPARRRLLARTRLERLVRDHLELVADVVDALAARFPRHVDRDELLDAGRLGLVEAARRYDPSTGVPFARYAAIRIRGAVLDSTRSRDWASRSVRRRARELAAVEQEMASGGRPPNAAALAAVLGISPAEVARLRADASAAMVLSLDAPDPDTAAVGDLLADTSPDAVPEDHLERRELVGTLREAVAALGGVQGAVIRRHYFGGEMLKDIAADLGVTEARVSQIGSEAVIALRRYFGDLYDGVPEVDADAPGKRSRAAFVDRLGERSTWRSRLAAADDPGHLVVDLRDPDAMRIGLVPEPDEAKDP